MDPVKHRVRRQVLSPAFSPNRVQELSSRILEKVKQLCEIYEKLAKSSTPVDINASFKAFTLDVISEIVFGEEFGVVDSPGFHHPHVDTLHAAIKQGWISRSFPILSQISLSLPERISTLLFPIPVEEFRRVRLIPWFNLANLHLFIKMFLATSLKPNKQKCGIRVAAYLQEREQIPSGRQPSTTPHRRNKSLEFQAPNPRKNKSVVLEMLLDCSAAKGHIVPNSAELTEEALTLLVAGNDTTANAMILGMYHICRDSAVQSRVEAELHAAFPGSGDEITLERVKDLPYVVSAVLKPITVRKQKRTLTLANQTATIKEILRCTHPVPGRLPRVVPPEGYQLFEGSFLKAGVSS